MQYRSKRIAEFNDAFRKTFEGGQVLITRGVESSGYLQEIMEAVKGYELFSPENDPWGEHDFGAIELHGVKYLWKIDYYDKSLQFHSPNETDPSATTRVLTITRADEY